MMKNEEADEEAVTYVTFSSLSSVSSIKHCHDATCEKWKQLQISLFLINQHINRL